MRMVAILVPAGVNAFDLVLGAQIFASTWLPDNQPGYDVRMCGESTTACASGQQMFSIGPRWPLETLEQADVVLVPGAESMLESDPRHREALRAAAARGAVVASICTGAFLLADAGLLDGLRATTHWRLADLFAARYPHVEVDPSVLLTDNGQILTSAGSGAGLDLCLHLVRRDYGSAVAADTARQMVLPLQRDGGQAQFITRPDPAQGSPAMQPLLDWIEEHITEQLTLADIAAHAGLSVRTVQRRFESQLGTTVLHWILNARIRRAQRLLETTDLPIDRVAEQSGFGSVASLRHHFTQLVGTAPRNYRKAFGDPTSVSR
ncbi:helix-turn-helix domain-containing protein [Nocardia brasiliensis]|uniref:Helix-turn-helix domain-containing protein n=1 Tax=Nocardia brasiliensis TaxID=37326 RepID=A0A6G9XME6_NOCBR|nr:helix-turn-helix domain-containing protein [Nocardia brasiliensis]QIS02084.1 helix-turn-helix domain-containing protein [Nocardia brasiliensis]